MNERLFGLELSPVVDRIGYLDCPIDEAVSAFLKWQKPILLRRGIWTRAKTVTGTSLSELLCENLQPVVSIEENRLLFVPSKSGTSTIVTSNRRQGVDVASMCSFLADVIQCRGARVILAPHGQPDQALGARILETYHPDVETILNIERSIALIHDGYEWIFETGDAPFEFEELEAYTNPRVKERFPLSLFWEYVRHLEIPVESESQLDLGSAVLVSKYGLLPRGRGRGRIQNCDKS